MKTISKRRCGCWLAFFLPVMSAGAQIRAERSVQAVSASADGSVLVMSIEDDRADGEIVAVTPGTGKVLWTKRQHGDANVFAFSDDGTKLAVGYRAASDTENGIEVLNARTGAVLAGQSDGPDGLPLGMGFPSWGGGVEAVAFAPGAKVLFGLSNDTLFAWKLASREYLWSEDVPDRLHESGDHEGPTGHVTAFALSGDGTRLAAVRDRAVYVMTAETTRPRLLMQHDTAPVVYGSDTLAFSPDGQRLALGTLGQSRNRVRMMTHLWTLNGGAELLPDCGGGVAWAADGQALACQNATGTHLRAAAEPAKDLRAAVPASDLPPLRFGGSLWAVAYHFDDWKDPKQPLVLNLVELNSGKRIRITLPGRP